MMHSRRRSDMVINSIAFNLPILEQFDQLSDIDNASSNTTLKQRRSNSCSSYKPTHLNEQNESFITPLLDVEKDHIWKNMLVSNENNIDIDIQDEIIIEDFGSNSNNDFAIIKATDFMNFLSHTKAQNDTFISETDSIINKLESLLVIHDNVTMQTSDFQSESTTLIDELDSLESLYSDLKSKFTIFQILESIVKRLNTANNSKIVLKSSFNNDILLKLDKCLQFVNDPSHDHYKDIAIYKFRFKQCMVRALTLIRNYLISNFGETETKITKRINELPNDKDNSIVIEALINTNFPESMLSFYNLFVEIYKRTNGNDDYFNLLDDVYNQYFKIRGNLLNTYIIQPYMNDVDFSIDLINLANVKLKFFNKVIEKEFEIFKKLFFLPPNEVNEEIDNSANLTAVHKFLESILDPLYYLLRNKIIRETKIDSLCELIDLIRSYLESEMESNGFSQYLDIQLNKIDYEELFKPILEDVQTRLVFRIHKFVESNIVNYKKTGKELIISNKSNLEVSSNTEKDYFDENNLILNSNMIYPPILDSIKLLTKIYQLLKQSVFDDITSTIVHLSLLSLKNNFGDNSTIDCKLYEIRSLILFKEYINTFEIEHARKETTLDFSGLKKLYSKFLGRKDKIELNSTEHESFFDTILGSIPKVVNDYVDCHIELQIELRNVVHDFIKITSKSFIGPLLSATVKEMTIDSLTLINKKIISNIKSELPRLKMLIKDYIKDKKTHTFLLDGIQEEIISGYTNFYNEVNNTGNGKLIAELLEVDELNKVWVDTVKRLFIEEDEADEAANDLLYIQRDIAAIQDDLLDADMDSVVTSTVTSTV